MATHILNDENYENEDVVIKTIIIIIQIDEHNNIHNDSSIEENGNDNGNTIKQIMAFAAGCTLTFIS